MPGQKFQALQFSNIANANAGQTKVTNLTPGVYQFGLKVTAGNGLYDMDTVKVTVLVSLPACENSNSPIINVQLVPIGALSQQVIILVL